MRGYEHLREAVTRKHKRAHRSSVVYRSLVYRSVVYRSVVYRSVVYRSIVFALGRFEAGFEVCVQGNGGCGVTTRRVRAKSPPTTPNPILG